ncbi:hypothetical protein SELMODRAFT_443383 [Selaginella moellendorffii]|uniref:UBA domain-containing protein n=1 Tax=Selaginella moellendorffii TaxID=88036 RepID=D8S0X6_SELML|nr:UBX domain-containing protein 1 [Selaginella moellendorffii]EFJ22008.1 hypothetical protein SELMODRAFT_443383 [Selaginella moellendorffii]|eukprot:XP_002976898.1 UBX domain-containing protein 1 [Selaginella moellendorffii]
MAGLSLQCGDCGAALRTVEEAQEHAEISGHANFVESTQAVLNLVCTACGKPCRSQTEVDLHTKRTGHVDFADKTAEAAKPVVLESGSKPEMMDVDPKEEMQAPEVNQQLLEELEAMGFPRARSVRSLFYSKAENLEGAVNWIVEHENDPDIDEELLVPASSLKPALTPEEAKAKAQELVERARKKKEEEEKKLEREREKERIRVGKELLEAKRKEEDSERKRILMYRKAEKEEEKRARDKIRQKIEEDRAERRRKLGLPPEEPKPADQAAAPLAAPAAARPADETKPVQQPKAASKAEELRSCLRSIKQSHKDQDAKVKKAFQTLQTYVGNIGRAPQEEKFRKIRVTNPTFQERVGDLGGVKFLELCGFELDPSGEFLNLAAQSVDIGVLRAADKELSSATTNPFFGVL